MTREPPLNLRRRDVGVVGALGRVEDVVAHVDRELDEACPDDREDRGEEVEGAVARGDHDAEHDRHDRRAQERQAGRAQDEERQRQARFHGRATLARQRVEVAARLAGGPLGVLEERDLGLVPAPRRRRGQLEAIAAARQRTAPDGDVPPLVVAVAGLRADVRAGERHVEVHRDRQAGRPFEGDGAGVRVHAGVDGDAERIAVRLDPGQDGVRIGGQLRESVGWAELRGRTHQAASPRSALIRGTVAVTPSGQ